MKGQTRIPWGTEYGKEFAIRTSGGLIVICVYTLMAFLSVGKLDIPATISVFALAIAIPFLAGSLLHAYLTFDINTLESYKFKFVYRVGRNIALIGVAFAIYHVSWIAFILFIGSGIITYLLTFSLV